MLADNRSIQQSSSSSDGEEDVEEEDSLVLNHADASTVRKTYRNTGGMMPKNNKYPNGSSSSPSPSSSIKFISHKNLNNEIIQATSFAKVLDVVQRRAKLGQVGAGSVMNGVNYSTAIHRLASFCARGGNYFADRAVVLSDPRTALILASMVESLLVSSSSSSSSSGDVVETIQLQHREISNIAWALAKLKLPPPLTAMPALTSTSSVEDAMMESATTVRQLVVQAALERRNNSHAGQQQPQTVTWVSALSQLAGHMLDYYTQSVIDGSVNLAPFRSQNLSNFLWALATAKRPNEEAFGMVAHKLIHKAKESRMEGTFTCNTQEWSNALWSFATTQTYTGAEELMEFVAELLRTDPEPWDHNKSQEIANTMWGVATLLVKKPAPISEIERTAALSILRSLLTIVVDRQANGFRAQELANSVWSLATIGFGISTTEQTKINHNRYIILETDRPADDFALMSAAVNTILRVAGPTLHRFKPQELNNLTWALARLLRMNKDAVDRALLEDLLWQVSECFSRLGGKAKGQDIGTTLWGFSQLDMKDPNLYRNVAVLVPENAALSYRPQELSNSVHALANSGIMKMDAGSSSSSSSSSSSPKDWMQSNDPLKKLFVAAGAAVMQRTTSFKQQELKDVLWSFATAELRHPALFRFAASNIVRYSVEELGSFLSQGLGNLAWAYGKHAQSGSTNIITASGRLGSYISVALDLGEDLSQRLFRSICKGMLCNFDNLRACNPQDISNTAWALAIMGFKDEQFMCEVRDTLKEKLRLYLSGDRGSVNLFNGQEIANTLWALATLDVPPHDTLETVWEYLQAVVGKPGEYTVESIAAFFNRQELGNMAWACAVFDHYPEEFIAFLYYGLIGPGTESDVARLNKAYKDGGLHGSTINTLIYVQTSRDKLAADSGPCLPTNFPGCWGAPDSLKAAQTSNDLQMIGVNEITTSKVQAQVSKAFHRIGFEYVEEFTMNTVDLASYYGRRETTDPIEIISIDIANANERIAIEVDGPAHYLNRIDGQYNEHIDDEEYSNNENHKFDWDGSRQEATGATLLKTRLLQELGWQVINIPFWEWKALNGAAEKEDAYCRTMLTTVLRNSESIEANT